MPRDPLANADQLLRRVYAYVAYRVRDRTDAEDLTSETFERALRYTDTYDPRKGEPIAWLLGIARRCVYDASLRPRHLSAQPEPAIAGDIAGDVVARISLSDALESLSASDRELIALRYGSDLSAREIGRLLEMRTNAVEVALSRARGRLRTALEGTSPAGEQRPARLADEPL
ncbi:MAG TPA: sigma-70 family RNA polymerase sigma factor [Gaiellaceae bacterium]|jgi:RNA polymerase sigma-70 factor (ECF subfamily)|nr:sigma-70 family RNA polymerase sigma factor [Gaiellaceae bacterium]